MKVACLEEIAYRQGFLSREEIATIALTMEKNDYGRYLLRMLDDDLI